MSSWGLSLSDRKRCGERQTHSSARIHKDHGDLQEQTRVLGDTLRLLRSHGLAVIDEVDWVLDPMKSELNFPLGNSVKYPHQEPGITMKY